MMMRMMINMAVMMIILMMILIVSVMMLKMTITALIIITMHIDEENPFSKKSRFESTTTNNTGHPSVVCGRFPHGSKRYAGRLQPFRVELFGCGWAALR